MALGSGYSYISRQTHLEGLGLTAPIASRANGQYTMPVIKRVYELDTVLGSPSTAHSCMHQCVYMCLQMDFPIYTSLKLVVTSIGRGVHLQAYACIIIQACNYIYTLCSQV